MSMKLLVGQAVEVKGTADQWPYERIVDEGTILDNTGRKYLVALKNGRENLLFLRSELFSLTSLKSSVLSKP